MNVNSNIIASDTSNYKNLGFPRQLSKKEEFKAVLDGQQFRSNGSLNENARTKYNKDQNLCKTNIENSDKAINENKSDDGCINTVEGAATKNLDNSYGNNELKEKIISFVEVVVDALKQNTKEPAKEFVSNDKSNEEVLQIQQVQQIQQILQYLNFTVQSVYKVSDNKNGENKLNSINLEQMGEEHLIGVEKLSTETKSMIKINISEIVALLEKLKTNNESQPQIFDVIQKLTTEVSQVNGDLNLLKVVNEKNTVEGNTTKNLNNAYDNNKLKEKIINFVDVAIDALKQNTKKPSKELVDNNNSTEEAAQVQVVQIQELLKSLSSMIQSNYERPVTLNRENELKPINLEKLVGAEELSPMAKSTLKNNLNEIVDLLEKSKGNTKESSKALAVSGESTEEVAQIQELLGSLSSMIQSTYETPVTLHQENELKPINLEKLVGVEKLSPMVKGILKNNLSEIVDLIEKSKGNKDTLPQILGVIKKLTTEATEVKGDLSLLNVVNEKPTLNGEPIVNEKLTVKGKTTNELNNSYDNNKLKEKIINFVEVANKTLKQNNVELSNGILKNNLNEIVALVKQLKDFSFQSVRVSSEEKSIKDNLLTQVRPQITKITSENQAQSLSNAGQDNKSSENRSFEEKFLNDLLSDNKDEVKISKTVSFMNQFESIKTIETPKTLTPNNLVINKNNFEVDVIKNIKFMEINNIKDLIVKMNPKELGEITIKLTMESGIMKANISAQNKETYNLLNQNVHDISDRLKNMDIKIQSLDINVYEDSTFFSKDSSEKNNDAWQHNDARQNNNSKTNKDLEEDISITNNYGIEENQVNKFV